MFICVCIYIYIYIHISDKAWCRHAHEQGVPSYAMGSPQTRSDYERDELNFRLVQT